MSESLMSESLRVTTSAAYFDEHPGSTELWSPGSPLFPEVEVVASLEKVERLTGGRLSEVIAKVDQ